MCTLSLGYYTRGEEADYRIPCESRAEAVEWVQRIGAQTAWPKTQHAVLELWPGEAPLVVRLDNVYSATVLTCEAFAAYERVRKDEEERNPNPNKENS